MPIVEPRADRRHFVGYVRVSTDEQAREGVSLEAQRESIRAFAKSQGRKLDRIYEDEYTGTTLDRPGFRQLAQDIEADLIDTVLVYKLDRLARSQRLTLQILEDNFEARSVKFKSVTEPFETSTAMGKAFLGMLAVFAQLERDTIVERTRHALSHKRSQGEHCGRPPFGYQIAPDGKLEKRPEQQQTIARIKRLRRDGKSFRSIAGLLKVPLSTVHRIVNDNLKTRNGKYLK